MANFVGGLVSVEEWRFVASETGGSEICVFFRDVKNGPDGGGLGEDGAGDTAVGVDVRGDTDGARERGGPAALVVDTGLDLGIDGRGDTAGAVEKGKILILVERHI